MRKSLLYFLSLSLLLGSMACSKSNKTCSTVTTQASASDVTTLQQYIQSSGTTATFDSRGFYYTISNPGSNGSPDPCNSITVNYVGKLTNGNTFDAANNTTFNLSGLIVGWQEGIPLIQKGGRIILYLPPSLAYGSSSVGNVPANSILIFTIDLISIN